SPRAWVADVGPDVAAAAIAGGLLWLIALWVACGLVATTVSLLPGRLGRLGRAVAHRLTPAALRRIVITAAGTSILLSPVAAVAAVAAPATGGSPAPTGTSAVLPPLGWPTDPAPPTNPATPTTPATPPTPGRPPDAATPTDPAMPTHAATPLHPARGTGNTSPGPQPTHTEDRVTVCPGDSLWSLAAHRLGGTPSAARIQAEWPRWYAANRLVIGADPDLLRPGASLLVPEPARTDTGT
ncbi:MAG TPA: LysM domain-containing protein, partial [Jatrophihabitans sp.]